MSTYFKGRKEIHSFTIPLDQEKSSITCKIYEQWEDTDNTTTARCGDPGVIEVKKTVGISKRDEQTLKSSIEGTVGVKGIAEIKSTIEAAVKREFSFQEEESTSKTSTFTSPKCGRKTMFVYQLIREYEFYYSKQKWGRNKSWARKIRERTNIHDFMPYIDEYDKNCNCNHPPLEENFDGIIVIDMGTVSIRAPYLKTPEGIEVKIDTSILKIPMVNEEDSLFRIPVADLPEMVIFLGDITGESIEAAFYEYEQPVPETLAEFELVQIVKEAEISISSIDDSLGRSEV